MKAEINDFGDIVITPCSKTEEYALKIWIRHYSVRIDNPERNEYEWVPTSKIRIEDVEDETSL